MIKLIKPLVSFVIPCFNQGHFLCDAVASAYASYSGECEIIIVDDASTDPRTILFLKEIQSQYPTIKIIKHTKNRGLSAARNTGITASSGEYIQLLDADDLLVPGKIDFQIAHLKLSKNIDISITDYFTSNEDLTIYNYQSTIKDFNLDLKDFLYKWERGLTIPIHCALFRRHVILHNLFNEIAGRYGGKEDWYFWCELSYKKHKIGYLNRVGAIYRLHPSSWTRSKKIYMGKSWIMAAVEIDKFVRDNEPEFLDSALSWYKEFYSQPDSEVEKNGIISVPEYSESQSDEIAFEQKIITTLQKLPKSKKKATDIQITIIIPIYNHYHFLLKCLYSAISQISEEVEILCIDDRSSDIRVRSLLTKLADLNERFRIVYNSENLGIASTINIGTDYAKGKYLAFLDCDDYLAPGSINKVLKTIKENAGVDYFFTDRIEIDEMDKFIRKATYGGYENIKPTGNIAADLMKGMVASHLKVIKKSKIMEVGRCNSSLSGVQDWDLALRISETGNFYYIQEPLYYHRIHSNSVTTINKASQFRKTNIVRRLFFERKFKHHIIPADLSAMLQQYLSGTQTQKEMLNERLYVLSDENVNIDKLTEMWANGWILIFDARKEYNVRWINFLKEYNSFFDAILIDDPRIMTCILPYLWSTNILYFPWKIRENNLS